MTFKGINWKEEIHNAVEMGKAGHSLQSIGESYGVSRQRIKQVFKKYGVNPAEIGVKITTHLSRTQKAKEHFEKWGDLSQDIYDIKRIKYRAKKNNAKRNGIPFTILFSEIHFPTHCPILGFELDYYCEKVNENSVSFDRIKPEKGYVSGNVQIISWRANRIKNNGTAKELRQIAEYLDRLQEIQLQ